MKKKIATLLIATLAFGVVGLTGCGANDGATNEATENAATETTQETEDADTADAATEETTDATTGELEVLKVGASITPHAEILAQVKDTLAQEGYDLQVVEYNDYVLPNTALEDDELDANFFQHQPYLDDFNAENGTHLVSVAAVLLSHLDFMSAKQIALLT